MAIISEKKRYKLGYSANLYEQALLEAAQAKEKNDLLRKRQVIKAQDMPWEDSRHGRMKHLVNEKTDCPIKAVNMYLMVLPPGGSSGKHRHMSEELLYIVEGKGHDTHWDPEVEITDKYYWQNKKKGVKYQWEGGDFVYIPPMVAHKHFNDDPKKPARFLAASNRVPKFLGYPQLEQLEDAADYKK